MNPLLKPEYILLLTLALAAFGAMSAWRTTAKCGVALRALATALRVAGLACLGVIAMNMGRYRHEHHGREDEWAVLIDRSASMAEADVGGKTRWDEAVRLVGAIRRAAGDKAKVRVYAFSDQLEPAPEGVGEIKADGATTDIIQAGRTLLSRYRSGDRNLAGVFLVSDGRQVAPGRDVDLVMDCRSQESPVYAMPVGGDVGRRDLSVSSGRRQNVAFAGQKLKIGAVIRNEGLGAITTEVSLAGPDGRDAGRQKVSLTNGAVANVQFDLVPAEKGYYEYRFRAPVVEGESKADNNEAVTSLVVLKDKIRVFVVEGTPGWDSKFLLQLLRKQANMEVTSVYRLSMDRFFKVETDVSKASESSQAIFPDSAEEMAAYDVIMVGKGVEYFLNPARVRLLGDFVREQGGSLFFYRGKPYSGRLAEIEGLEPVTWGEAVGVPFRFRPSRAGEYAGLFGEVLPGPGDESWNRLPVLQVATRCSSLKPFTQIFVEGVRETDGRESGFPVVASRRFGKGMIVLMNAEGLWQWDFFPSSNESGETYKELWAQLLQWSATYSEFLPGQEYSLRLSSQLVLPGTPVSARIGRRKGGTSSSAPKVRVYSGGTVVQELDAAAVSDAENRWMAVVSMEKPGTYKVEVAGETGTACAVLEVQNPPVESDNRSVDRQFMERLAAGTGGRVVDESEVAAILKPREKAVDPTDTSKAVWVPVWDRWWFLCGMLLCFAIEWFVRRRNGLL